MTEPVETMIDIETLDIGPRAVVLSVAIVDFTQSRGNISAHSIPLAIQPQINLGRTISESTLLWWMQQSEEARGSTFTKSRESIPMGLGRISWACSSVDSNRVYWAKGPDFDMVILGSLFADVGMHIPWHHRSTRDVRTLQHIANIESTWTPENASDYVAHDPVSDCLWQIELVREARRRLNSA